MSRHDPTLPRSDTATLPESDLITRVKTEQDSDALTALVNRHTGLYFSVVNRYAAAYPNVIKARELDEDKLFNIYTFIQAFDPTRGMKLSSYIGDRTDYMCKDMLKQDKRNPLSPGIYAASGVAPLDVDDDTYSTTNGGQVTLQDTSPTARVIEVANLDVGISDIRRVAEQVCPDPRFIAILDYRNESLSWREVGKRLNLSHEACRKVYNHNLARVKEKLNT